MSRDLELHNRQRLRPVRLPLLRQLLRHLLLEELRLETFTLGVYLVEETEMIRLNATFLHHAGSTDVITFPDDDTPSNHRLAGEIVVCVAEAVSQAARFRATWPSELVRYVIHGVLHLQGHDDARPGPRAKMKRAENRLLRALDGRFPFSQLGRPTRRTRPSPRPRARPAHSTASR